MQKTIGKATIDDRTEWNLTMAQETRNFCHTRRAKPASRAGLSLKTALWRRYFLPQGLIALILEEGKGKAARIAFHSYSDTKLRWLAFRR